MNDNVMDTDTTIDELSRPFKRRRPNRKPVDSPPRDQALTAEPPCDSNSTPRLPSTDDALAEPPVDNLEDFDDDDQSSLSVVDILRRRRIAQRKRAGIGFTNATVFPRDSAAEAIAEDAILDKDASLDKILTVVDRFAPQTGQVADVDKHMYAKPKVTMSLSEKHMLTL
ncbi:MAG: hypothetical protein Q9168_003124 [Polycauliona sp. 1 TL-2023]